MESHTVLYSENFLDIYKVNVNSTVRVKEKDKQINSTFTETSIQRKSLDTRITYVSLWEDERPGRITQMHVNKWQTKAMDKTNGLLDLYQFEFHSGIDKY